MCERYRVCVREREVCERESETPQHPLFRRHQPRQHLRHSVCGRGGGGVSVCLRQRVCGCDREKESVCKRERERVCVCVYVKERVCVSEREGESPQPPCRAATSPRRTCVVVRVCV